MDAHLKRNKLIYDGACPFCDNYVGVLRLRELNDNFEIIDARESHESILELLSNGIDIDKGMVLIIGHNLYHGPEAIHQLALLTGNSSLIRRLNYFLFRSRLLARTAYPFFRIARKIVLYISRKPLYGERNGPPVINTISRHSDN